MNPTTSPEIQTENVQTGSRAPKAPQTGFGKLAARLGAVAVAAMAALSAAGCGNAEDKASDAGVADAGIADAGTNCGESECCAQECCPTKVAPQVEIEHFQFVTGNRLKVPVKIPAFDVTCQGPLKLYIVANLWRNPNEGPVHYGQDPFPEEGVVDCNDGRHNSCQKELYPGKEISGPGEDFIEGEIPVDEFGIPSSAFVRVYDNTGGVFNTKSETF